MHSGSQVMKKKTQISMADGLQNTCSLIQKSSFMFNLAKVNIQVELFKGKLRKIWSSPF